MCIIIIIRLLSKHFYVSEQFQKGWPEPVVAATTRRAVKTEKAKLWSTTVGEY